ncbi:MAG: flagellin [Armatimonadota bacterium]|nr:flagellin [Armatimonadota bacterium]
MRITLGMLTGRIRTNLAADTQRLLEAQDRASSGKRIHRPSDDVPGVGRAISLRSALASVEQFDRNSGIAGNLLSVANDALNSVVARLQDVRSLALTAASSTINDEARVGITTRLDTIAVELQSVANTQYLGRYVFSGSLSNTEAVVANGAGSPPYIFQGDNSGFEIQVAPGTFMTANVTADMVLNMGGVAIPGSPDVFSTLETLKSNIMAGDAQAVSDQIAEIDAQLRNAVAIRSQIGGRVRRLESTNDALLDSKLKIQDLLSKTEDADLAEAVLDLRTRETVYQAALSAASRVLDISLANMWK